VKYLDLRNNDMRDKVLIIDDEEVIRGNLKKLLSLDGYEVLPHKMGMTYKNENRRINI